MFKRTKFHLTNFKYLFRSIKLDLQDLIDVVRGKLFLLLNPMPVVKRTQADIEARNKRIKVLNTFQGDR